MKKRFWWSVLAPAITTPVKKNIVACERDLAASCPDRDLFRAFTSGMIIRKLRQRDGIDIDTPLQALQKLAAQGYQDVAIQSLHIINGDEYEKLSVKYNSCVRYSLA